MPKMEKPEAPKVKAKPKTAAAKQSGKSKSSKVDDEQDDENLKPAKRAKK